MRTTSAWTVNEEMDPRLPYHEHLRPDRTLEICIDKNHPKQVVSIGAHVDETIRVELEQLLQEHVHIFASSMADMKGINMKITSHELNIDSTIKPIK